MFGLLLVVFFAKVCEIELVSEETCGVTSHMFRTCHHGDYFTWHHQQLSNTTRGRFCECATQLSIKTADRTTAYGASCRVYNTVCLVDKENAYLVHIFQWRQLHRHVWTPRSRQHQVNWSVCHRRRWLARWMCAYWWRSRVVHSHVPRNTKTV